MNKDSFYTYDCLFWDLHVRVSFDDFTIGILCILNMDPMQLYPNGWEAMQAFCTLCLHNFGLATLGLFLHYFCSHPHPNGWISLIWISKLPLFCTFTSSNKIF